MLNSTTGSDKKTLKEAAEENGYGTASLCFIITALSATGFTFRMTGDELVKMSELIPKDDVYYVYELLCEDNSWPGEDIVNDGDESDGDSDSDHSNGDSDGDHSDDDDEEDRSSTYYQHARDTPLMQNVNGRCGKCDGKVVELKGLMWRWYCSVCGQAS